MSKGCGSTFWRMLTIVQVLYLFKINKQLISIKIDLRTKRLTIEMIEDISSAIHSGNGGHLVFRVEVLFFRS